jgi:arylsulfatase A-like enzyme
VPSGAVTDALTDFSDMLPTFAELGGAKLPKGRVVDGRSIASLILGRAKDSDREWIMALGSQSARLNEAGRVVGMNEYKERAIRDKRYKLVVGTDRKSQGFYDLKRDPGEADNLIGSADKGLVAARKKLEAVIAGQPQKDAAPIYDAMPAQPWDRKPARSIKKEKKGGK